MTLGVQVSVWVCDCCGCSSRSCRCSHWSGRAGAASRRSCIASRCTTWVIAAGASLVRENLGEKTTLLESTWAVASRCSARIASCDFNTAGWSCVAWIARSDFCTAGWSARITSRSTVARLELALETNKLALEVTFETLEGIQNWRANFAAAGSTTRIARCDFNSAARSCVTWIARCNFNSARWTAGRSARCDFNAAGWIADDGVTARAGRAATFSTEQAVQEVTTEALSTKGSTDNQRTDNDIPFHLSQISLRICSLPVTYRSAIVWLSGDRFRRTKSPPKSPSTGVASMGRCHPNDFVSLVSGMASILRARHTTHTMLCLSQPLRRLKRVTVAGQAILGLFSTGSPAMLASHLAPLSERSDKLRCEAEGRYRPDSESPLRWGIHFSKNDCAKELT